LKVVHFDCYQRVEVFVTVGEQGSHWSESGRQQHGR
jgi:hypothetical protein